MPSRRQALRCRARSNRTGGQQCQAWAINGGTVCRVHGGSTRHVKEAARARLEAMVMPALVQLRRLIDEADGDAVKLAAVRDVLDRCGLKPADLVKVDTAVEIRVSYADVGPAPPPGHVRERANGHHALDGPEGV